jgi:hypothetical protein
LQLLPHGATLSAAAERSRCEVESFLQSKATEEVYTPFAAIRYHLAFAPPGYRAALNEVMGAVYQELRRVARRHMARQRPGPFSAALPTPGDAAWPDNLARRDHVVAEREQQRSGADRSYERQGTGDGIDAVHRDAV